MSWSSIESIVVNTRDEAWYARWKVSRFTVSSSMLTPETDSTTDYHFIALRFGVHTPPEDDEQINERIAKTRLFAFAEQDAPIIEAQQRSIDSATRPLSPSLLSIDSGLVRCKRVMQRLLQED